MIVALLLSAHPPVRLSAQDPGSLNDLAQLLMLEDRREFNGPSLQRAAQHPDPRVRERAAMSLGRIGDHAGTPLLLRLLIDQDTTVRTEAAFALGELGDVTAVTELAARADRFAPVETTPFAIEVVTALAKLGGPAAEAALDRVLERHPPGEPAEDRATATVLIEAWRLPKSSAVVRRLPDYVRSGLGDWKRSAVYSSVRLVVPAAAASLTEAARDEDALTRSWAAQGLSAPMADSARIPRETFVATLRTLINDRDARVRINALRALSTYGDSLLAPLALPRLSDRDNNVAMQAAITAGRLGGSRSVAGLVERFPAAPSSGLRRALAVALARADAARALELVQAWRGDPDWYNRAAWIEVAGTARTAAARQQLEELLDDTDPRVVGLALGALAAFVPETDSALLTHARTLLDSPDPIVRAGAIGVLARTRDMATVRDLAAAYRRAETDPVGDARLAAADALADLAETPAGRAQGDAIFLGAFTRSGDYQVRRLVARRFGEAAHRRAWGAVLPVETGRNIDEYRDLARRYAFRGADPGRISIETERGTLQLQLLGYDAPLTVENFLRLVDRRYFDNGRWHRVVPNFVAQDGDQRGDGSGSPGTVIRDEINRKRYYRGTVGMALSGPDTGGSQFFITHSAQPHLDGGYTVFGEVVAGWDVLDQIVQGDRIRRIYR